MMDFPKILSMTFLRVTLLHTAYGEEYKLVFIPWSSGFVTRCHDAQDHDMILHRLACTGLNVN